ERRARTAIEGTGEILRPVVRHERQVERASVSSLLRAREHNRPAFRFGLSLAAGRVANDQSSGAGVSLPEDKVERRQVVGPNGGCVNSGANHGAELEYQ